MVPKSGYSVQETVAVFSPEEEFLRNFLQISHSCHCLRIAHNVHELCTCSARWLWKVGEQHENLLVCEIIKLVLFLLAKHVQQDTKGIRDAELKEKGTELTLNFINIGDCM